MASPPLVHAPCYYSPTLKYGNGKYSPAFSTLCVTYWTSGMNNTGRSTNLRIQAMSTTHANVAAPKEVLKSKYEPNHLLVLVHGILASPSDWTYFGDELKRRLGSNFLIYASSSNTYTKTFGGIDGAGKRLADEVMEVVQRTESLKKISFLAHSLGGLFARYAIAVLYSPSALASGQPDDLYSCEVALREKAAANSSVGKIAGLEPTNFITLATPHLGVRGKNQLPFLLGVPLLEKLAPPIAPFFVGRTGRQLFLTDGKPSRPPLLLRMASDGEDGKFISALKAFKYRTVYANVSYDHMVGWRTSSIRREKELVKPPRRSLDGYKHVVDVEYCPPMSCDGPHFPLEAAKAKEAAQTTPCTQNTSEYHDIMEEEMIQGLQRVGWKKVDVSFHSAPWPFFAHNNIHDNDLKILSEFLNSRIGLMTMLLLVGIFVFFMVALDLQSHLINNRLLWFIHHSKPVADMLYAVNANKYLPPPHFWVKSEWLHNAGAGVVAHVADSLKRQESLPYITANL